MGKENPPEVARDENGELVKPVVHPDPMVRKYKEIDDLRQAGYNDADICEIVSLPFQELERVEQRAWEILSREQTNAVPQARALANRRMNRLLRAVWPKAIDPRHPEQLAAHQRALATIDRLVKLEGLDAPQEVVVHRATEEQINAWVAAAYATQDNLPDEADIFDAEWTEEDE